MNITDNLVFMNYNSIWNNFVIYTSYDFQDKWAKLDNWSQLSNFKTCNFIHELVNEISLFSTELLISFKRWSSKKKINYIENLINEKIKTQKINDTINKNINKNIITSSCFTPPDFSFLQNWNNEKNKELNNFDELSDSSSISTNYNKDENLLFDLDLY